MFSIEINRHLQINTAIKSALTLYVKLAIKHNEIWAQIHLVSNNKYICSSKINN
jgi:hypothetical protein